ncbi:hypothetical protein K501DRAFT_268379 [Backusella circina FSU 941]|nr:hypothetical protein K501DRAFT_268379 [Backusella circina FSU 941]
MYVYHCNGTFQVRIVVGNVAHFYFSNTIQTGHGLILASYIERRSVYDDLYGFMYYRLAEVYTTLSYESIDVTQKSDYLSRLQTFWIIKDEIDNIQLYNLGMQYYTGMLPVISKKGEHSRSKDNNNSGMLVPVDYNRAKVYHTMASVKGNQKAHVN